jgi:hypothetical protein
MANRPQGKAKPFYSYSINTMTANDFMPKGYAVPTKKGGYLKLQEGETKIRITASPLVGWEDWKDNKPVRTEEEQKPLGTGDDGKVRIPKHFRAMPVYDYADGEIKILSVTQKAIMNTILDYMNTEEYGSPLGYDLKITKTGKGMETKYAVVALPPKELSKEIKAKIDSVKVNLPALWDNGDPFEVVGEDIEDILPF